MPPKKKDSEAAVPSASLSPPPEQTGGGVDAGGRMGVDEGALSAAKSKDKAAQTSASMRAPRLSQEARDQQCHSVRSAIRPLTQDQARVNAGSGSHNLDAPYLARQRCRGKLIHGHLWGRRTEPLSVRRGAEITRRADRGEAHEQFTQLRSSPER